MRHPGKSIITAILWTAAFHVVTFYAADVRGQEPPEPEPPPVKVERARIVPPGTPIRIYVPKADGPEDTAATASTEPAPSTERGPEDAAPVRPVADSPATAPSAAPAPRRSAAPILDGTAPGHHAVRQIRLVKEGAGRVDAARQDDWIAFDMAGADERYDVYVMRLEIGEAECLTCERWEFRKENVLNPAWHPSGEYLIVQVQNSPLRRGMNAARLAEPHRALGSELWVITRDAKDAWQITLLQERGAAVLDPHFSHEAGLLVWSERLTNKELPWGEWGLRVASFKIRHGVPALGKTRTYKSGLGDGLAIAHGFTPDDGGLLVSAYPDRRLPEPDILRLDLESERIERLTASPDQLDELVASMPYSDYYVWVTDRALDDPRYARGGVMARRTELWLRSASGAKQERLTYFNHSASGHYLGAARIVDLSWMADGESLLLQVLSTPEGSVEVGEAIYQVKLSDEYRR